MVGCNVEAASPSGKSFQWHLSGSRKEEKERLTLAEELRRCQQGKVELS
jgi:hypothetical protein